MAQWCLRAFTSPLLWPGFDSWTWDHMKVEFVIAFCPCSQGSSPGPSVFLSSRKTSFQIPIRPRNSGQEKPPSGNVHF